MSNGLRKFSGLALPALVISALILSLVPLPVYAAAPVISDVGTSSITETAAIISWTTNIDATGNVDYGIASGVYTSTSPTPVDSTADNTSHAVLLSGLSPNTFYYYVVKSSDGTGETTSAESSFKTTAFTISGVAASGITTNSATITWTTSVVATGNVEYGEDTGYGSTAPNPVDSSADNTSQIVVLSGLDANTTYHYRVISKDASDNEEMSPDKTFDTLPDTAAPVISSVASSGITQTGATITWNTNEFADSQVEYGTSDSYGSTTPVDATLVTGHNLSLSGLSPSTTYHYRVKSKDASNNEALSIDYTFTTSADTTAPVISSVASSAITQTQATITWTTDELATGNLDYGLATSYGTSAPSTADTTADKTSQNVVLSGLLPNTTYHYQVKSKDASNNEALSIDYTFTTSADITAPVISGVASSGVTQTSATITWTTNELATSNLAYGLTTGYGTAAPSPVDATADKTSHSVILSSLFPSTTYHYQVKSKDASNNEALSIDYSFTTLADITAPVISSVASSGVTQTSATITWTTNELATSNLVYGLTTGYGTSAPSPADATADKTSHSIVVSGLSPNTTYHYQVKSKDASTNESLSIDYSFTTLADTTAPVISSVVSSGIDQTSATINWNTSELADSQVEYGLSDSYGSTTAVDAALVTNHSIALSGFLPGTTYHYRVKSRDASGNQAVSGDYTFATLLDSTPPVISDITATDSTITTVTITWNTDEPATSRVDYGLNTSYGSSTPFDANLVTNHSVVLSGLIPSTTYYYRVKSQDAAPNEAVATAIVPTFTTSADSVPPPAPDLISPSDGAIATETSPTFDWSDVYDPSGVVYSLQVDDTIDFSSPVVAATSLSSSVLKVPSALAGGIYYWRVKAIDGNGNEGDWSVIRTYVVDITGPAVSITPLTPDPTNDNTPTLTGTAADISSPIGSVEYRVNGGSWISATAADGAFNSTSENYTFTAAALADGSYTVEVRATDSLGNATAEVNYASDAFKVDTVAPSVTVTPLTPDPTNDNTPTLTGTAADTSSPIVSVQYSIDGGSTWIAATAVDGTFNSTTESYTFTTAVLADGSYTVKVRATDTAGNTTASGNYASDTFNIDTVAPSVTITALTPDPTSDNSPTLTGTATDTASPIASVEYRVNGGDWIAAAASDGSFNSATEGYTFTTAALVDGSYTVDVRATDTAGNTTASGAYVSDTFKVDTGAPAVNINPLTPDPTNDSTPSFTGTAADDDITIAAVEYRVNGGDWIAATAADGAFNSTSESYGFTTAALVDGSYTVEVRATDSAGNTTAASNYASDTFKIDTVAPAVTITALTPDPTNDNTPTLTGTATDSASPIASVEYRVNGGSWISASASDGTFNSASEGYTFTVAALADGAYTLDVRATDVAGNSTVAANYASDSFKVDTTAPAVTITALTPDPTNDSTPTLTGTATDLANPVASVEYRINGGSWIAATAADGAFNSTSEGYTFTVSALADGSCTVEVRATDTAGNTTAAANYANDTFVIDTIAPAISGVVSGSITATSATITWTTGEMSTSNLVYGLTTSYGSSSPATADITADTTSHSVALSGLTPGTTYHYQVKSRDAAGNEAVSADYTFTTSLAAQNISPTEAATVETADGKISIQLPAGSVASNAVLTISEVAPGDIPAAPSGFKAGATSFKVEMTTALAPGAEVTITVKYSDADVAAAGGDAKLLRLSRYDAGTSAWVVLDTTVDTTAQTLSATTSKFSTWMVMVSEPESAGSSVILIVVIALVVILVVAGGAVILSKRKSGGKPNQKQNIVPGPGPGTLPQ